MRMKIWPYADFWNRLLWHRHRAKAVIFAALVLALPHGNLGAQSDALPANPQESLRELADRGDASAQAELGLNYYLGQGVTQDFSVAERWLRLAAEQGDATAQFNLGSMCYQGHGKPRDYAGAFYWFRSAAEQGNVDAQYILADMYLNGQGTQKSNVMAAQLFRKAAEQGDSAAQFKLGVMYNRGRGVPKDHVEAYKWFNIAAASGNAKATEYRDMVGENMTLSQIAEAKRLSQDFVAHSRQPSGESH